MAHLLWNSQYVKPYMMHNNMITHLRCGYLCFCGTKKRKAQASGLKQSDFMSNGIVNVLALKNDEKLHNESEVDGNGTCTSPDEYVFVEFVTPL